MPKSYPARVCLFLASVLALVAAVVVLFQGSNALWRLVAVERERDSWQKPSEVLHALSVDEGSTVLDLGCGFGYFTLKLSRLLGKQGRVLAEDIRTEPLVFLWIRGLAMQNHNVSIIHGRASDSNVGDVRLDAVLISNTYHEIVNSRAILAQLHQALRSGGRLVIVDQGLELPDESRHEPIESHHIGLNSVREEIVGAGFHLLQDQEHFIERPGHSPWWLLVATKS